MQYRNLGSSGLKVSAIGLGTNQFGGKVDADTAQNIIHAALDGGVNFIDTADIYQDRRSEEYIGQALRDRRDRVLIATKFFHARGEVGPNEKGASRYHILNAVEASLRRLNSDYIDLYQIHRWDEDTPIEETMHALDDLVSAGKVRYIGASNFKAWQLAEANAISEARGWHKFVSIQSHYHMLERGIENELLPACSYFGIGVLPYFPLAGGFLTGKYEEGQPPPAGSRAESSQYVQNYLSKENYAIIRRLSEFSKARGRSLTELAHAWLLAQPMVASVISGATQVDHVEANVLGADWELTEEDVEAVNSILKQDSLPS